MAVDPGTPRVALQRWMGWLLLAVLAIATLACGELGQSFDEGEMKTAASKMIGHTPTDGEIRSACRALEQAGWSYNKAGMSAPLSGAGQDRVALMAAITGTFGGRTETYCQSKL